MLGGEAGKRMQETALYISLQFICESIKYFKIKSKKKHPDCTINCIELPFHSEGSICELIVLLSLLNHNRISLLCTYYLSDACSL